MPQEVCRRLLLFLDGTWNEDDDDKPASNIVYLRERLFWGLQTRLRDPLSHDAADFNALPDVIRNRVMSGVILDGFEYIIFYDRGVGTGPFLDVIKGGVAGDGLNRNIREAYRFLSAWYRPGDEIYVFGFSRGAFTARSLCGYLNAVGLLRAGACTPSREKAVWSYYRTAPADRLSGDWHALRADANGAPAMHDGLRVRALCVFDTVGALGIPANGLRRFNRQKYQFHDTEMNSLVDIQLHAVAIDEPRPEFEPAMWTKPKFKLIDRDHAPIEQVWFPGAHSDIGGGYTKWNQGEKGLSHLPLAWMLQRLQHYVTTNPPIGADGTNFVSSPNYQAPLPFFTTDLLDDDRNMLEAIRALAKSDQHKPWAALSAVRPDLKRVINQIQLPGKESAEEGGRVPFADPIGEMVHVAALERFDLADGVVVDKDKVMNFVDRINVFRSKKYRPNNLLAILPYIAATYLRYHRIDPAWCAVVRPVYSWKEITVVGWDGMPIDPSDKSNAERVLALLPKPAAIDLNTMPDSMHAMLDPRVKYWPGANTGQATGPPADGGG